MHSLNWSASKSSLDSKLFQVLFRESALVLAILAGEQLIMYSQYLSWSAAHSAASAAQVDSSPKKAMFQ